MRLLVMAGGRGALLMGVLFCFLLFDGIFFFFCVVIVGKVRCAVLFDLRIWDVEVDLKPTIIFRGSISVFFFFFLITFILPFILLRHGFIYTR